MLFDSNAAAALAQILAVLLLAVGFSSTRKGVLRRPPAGDSDTKRKKRQRRLKEMSKRERRTLRWVILSCGGAALAIYFFVFVVAFGTYEAFGFPVTVIHIAGVALTLVSTPGLVSALLGDIADHWLASESAEI